MAKIDKTIIDRILDTARIEEVVGDFIELKKKGVRYLGLCPFHDDHHTGSFVVYPRGNCFKCFSCDAKGGVVDFLMQHGKMSFPDAIRWLGRKYNIETDDLPFDYTPPPARPLPPPLPMLELPMEMVKARERIEMNPLVCWIKTINWDTVSRARLPEVMKEYHVGTARNGMTIWWQIDEQQRVRTGKMMLYGIDGHRNKESKYNFDFIHAALFRDPRFPQYDEDKQEPQQCLFGLHLLDHYKRPNIDQTVCIVESEKTAVLMAIAYGNHPMQVWMACGGIESLNHTKLKPLIQQHRRIVLYPDRDGIQKWQQKAESLHYDRLVVDATPVTKWWKPCDGEKADIADIVVRMLNSSKPMTTIDDVKKRLPNTERLIDKFDLELTANNEDYRLQKKDL